MGVAVPARDEAARVGRCVASVLTALRALPPSVERAFCVVADRCSDGTAHAARRAFGGVPGAWTVGNRAEATVGEVRDLGFARVLAALPGHAPAGVLLLSTDADSVVAPDWALGHLRLVRAGAHAVAGMVDLADEALPPLVSARHAALLDRMRRPDGHGNVYGANLAVRADAHLAVGGFGPVASGEDHDLWRRLRRAGYRCRYAEPPTVRTSARLRGRATGGLADLLRRLDHESCVRAAPEGPGVPRSSPNETAAGPACA